VLAFTEIGCLGFMDGRSITSVENGKLGGRPQGSKNKSTIAKEEAREIMIRRVIEEFDNILTPQITKAMKGDYAAYKDLMDRVFGRAQEKMDITSAGKPIFVSEEIAKKNDINTGTVEDSTE